MKTTQHTPTPYSFSGITGDNYICAKRHRSKAGNDVAIAVCEVVERNPLEAAANLEFIVTACNWFDEAREALTEIAILCEADTNKTNWQDILRRANGALEHLQSAQGKE